MIEVEAGRTAVTVSVLGDVRAITSDGSVIELPSRSQRRLLAILAVHAPRRLRAEWLADQLDLKPGALRTSISRLRALIGADALQTSATGYALVAEVDASQFTAAVALASASEDRADQLVAALAIWGGPALDEFEGEEWADGEIARLTEIHAGTVDDLAEELIAARRSADAVARLERQIADHPYRDRSRGLLIRALACGGRQSDALAAFQRYHALLVDELGTEPSPEVVRTERRVASGWDGVDAEPAPSRRYGAITLPVPLQVADPFVGRSHELEALAEGLARARESKLRTVVISGESGMGKTTLLAAFAESAAAASSATVLYGRCEETGVPLEPFGTVLRTCVEHAPDDILGDHVARIGGELRRICPMVSRRVPTAPEPASSDPATERFLAFEAAADLIARIAARRPVALLLDDIQWAEPTALLLLRHLGRALADDPVLVVVAGRDMGALASDELRLALADLERGEASRLALSGLEGQDLADLVAVTLPPTQSAEMERITESIRRDSAGNPLYASHLIRHWSEVGTDELPPSLRDLVWSRVRAMGGDVPDVLTQASVLGTEFHEDVLEAMVDVPEPVVSDVIDAATAAGLLVDMGSVRRSVRFTHGLVAQALYSELGASRRARLHERAARALEKSVDAVPPDIVVQLARHTARAGLAAEALRWAVLAGDHAIDQLAPLEAAQHFGFALEMARAIDAPDAVRADLLVRLGDAQVHAGQPEALETLEQAAELARACGADDCLIRAAIAADRGYMRLDDHARVHLDIVEAALACADPDDRAVHARLLAIVAHNLVYTPDRERRVQLAHRALEVAAGAGDLTLLARVAPAALYALWAPGTERFRSRVATDAIAAAEASGDPWLGMGAHLAAYNVAVEGADPVAAARSLAQLRAFARDHGEPRIRWTVGVLETFEATMAGRLEDAEDLATRNLELGLQTGVLDAFTFFAGQYFSIGTFAGRHTDLLPLTEQAVHDNPGMVSFEVAHAIICAAVGRTDAAQATLDAGIAKGVGELPADNMWTTAVIGYAVLAIELNDVDAAAQLMPLIAPLEGSVSFNGVTSQGPIAAYVGRLASLLGEHELAEDHLRAALETATAFGWQYHRATTMIALCQARRRRLGSLDPDARAWLAEASELCRTGGFASWSARIAALRGR